MKISSLKFWKKKSIRDLLPPPVKADHGEYSMIFSACDRPAKLTSDLLQLSLKAIQYAASIDLGEICHRNEQAKVYAHLWPGEHYRLLAGLMLALPAGGKLVTFDVVSWKEYPHTLLKESDFDQQLLQHVDNLGRGEIVQKYKSILQEAELIFIDATHDGELEAEILSHLQKLSFKHKVFVLFDDIRVWTMLKMWREVSLPKIDLTSFGHWSGTGLVELS
jgi:hypothetical protein